jgi:hypothetical protein
VALLLRQPGRNRREERDYTSRNSLGVVDACRSFAKRVFTRGCERMCGLFDILGQGFPGRELSTHDAIHRRDIPQRWFKVITRVKYNMYYPYYMLHTWLSLGPFKIHVMILIEPLSSPAMISPKTDVNQSTRLTYFCWRGRLSHLTVSEVGWTRAWCTHGGGRPNSDSSLLVFARFQYAAFCHKLVPLFFASWLTTDLLEF